MTAIIKNDVRVFNANQFINAFSKKNYTVWETATAYSAGDIVVNGSYKYIASSSGTSGATPPTHTSGSASDGAVDWMFVEVAANTSFFENNLYVAIGKVDEWTAEPTPDAPLDDDATKYPDLASVLSAKRLESNSVSYAIQRFDWVSGMAVVQYDPTVESFAYANAFYVFTDENNIYKCLHNHNGSVSTSKPTGTAVDPFITADSFVWQYMGTVDASQAIQFLTSGYIPVSKKLADDSSAQWNVQQNAKKGSVSTVTVTDGGTGYTTATVTFDAAPAGGTDAQGIAIINGGVVEEIQVTTVGEGYETTPAIVITGDGADATADAVLAPKDGHGANILTELNARFITINARFDDTEGGYFPITGENDFRQIQLLVDPKDISGDLATAPRYIGPDHDDWDGAETSGKSEFMKGSGVTLYVENIAPVVRSSGQIEDIKVVLKF
jgi:hypothetical protein